MFLLLTVVLTGCFPASYPTQQKPVCSWASQPPSSASTLCRIAFQTLTTIVRAEQTGNDRTIRRLVTSLAVAGRVAAYGAGLRAQGNPSVHVVPSFTLDTGTRPGLLGANFSLVGKTEQGGVNTQETVYLRIRHGTADVVDDQPGEDW